MVCWVSFVYRETSHRCFTEFHCPHPWHLFLRQPGSGAWCWGSWCEPPQKMDNLKHVIMQIAYVMYVNVIKCLYCDNTWYPNSYSGLVLRPTNDTFKTTNEYGNVQIMRYSWQCNQWNSYVNDTFVDAFKKPGRVEINIVLECLGMFFSHSKSLSKFAPYLHK